MSKSTQIATLGDESILDLPKVGFLSSRKVPPAAVMKCYDWATEMRDWGVCVMGGYQSPLERDVLTLLFQGKQPVVWVLAHKLWIEKGVPKHSLPKETEELRGLAHDLQKTPSAGHGGKKETPPEPESASEAGK